MSSMSIETVVELILWQWNVWICITIEETMQPGKQGKCIKI